MFSSRIFAVCHFSLIIFAGGLKRAPNVTMMNRTMLLATNSSINGSNWLNATTAQGEAGQPMFVCEKLPTISMLFSFLFEAMFRATHRESKPTYLPHHDPCELGLTKLFWASLLAGLSMILILVCIPVLLEVTRRKPPGSPLIVCDLGCCVCQLGGSGQPQQQPLVQRPPGPPMSHGLQGYGSIPPQQQPLPTGETQTAGMSRAEQVLLEAGRISPTVSPKVTPPKERPDGKESED
eukprot:TRINITY_DN5687_c0_g1_i1.p1 TRINITY_DN5687_c0_g1~~TRINITY_DN5687_c0_g1_i1.p1  ORF type:complete len:236 (+),score=23.47 TRINITY_DN5687_c0_g1_i1:133-840(+)